MLELIVLGRIPGTHTQITFTWSLAAAAIYLLVVDSYLIYQRHRQTKDS